MCTAKRCAPMRTDARRCASMSSDGVSDGVSGGAPRFARHTLRAPEYECAGFVEGRRCRRTAYRVVRLALLGTPYAHPITNARGLSKAVDVVGRRIGRCASLCSAHPTRTRIRMRGVCRRPSMSSDGVSGGAPRFARHTLRTPDYECAGFVEGRRCRRTAYRAVRLALLGTPYAHPITNARGLPKAVGCAPQSGAHHRYQVPGSMPTSQQPSAAAAARKFCSSAVSVGLSGQVPALRAAAIRAARSPASARSS